MKPRYGTHDATQGGRRHALLTLTGAVAAVLLLAALAPSAAPAKPGEEPQVSQTTMELRGKFLYRDNCSNCHGENAEGDGNLAQYLTVKPTDLTRLAKKNRGEFPVEAVRRAIDGRYEVAGHGRREMPVWGDILRGDEEGPEGEAAAQARISELIAYLETLQEGTGG